ncbi:MAG TPA: helix-turn-helix transcriptional regulator, partial [Acidimicrobiales bacterium]|nr:helix-turn-helix transcriptional regulator [Acidimicrobiales bacterium]
MGIVEISLNPVSYVVLGFAAQHSPVTSYDLKQMVAGSVGYFWPFPHSQLYAEPARLVAAGLLDEDVEATGRRRRLYRITPAGRSALR